MQSCVKKDALETGRSMLGLTSEEMGAAAPHSHNGRSHIAGMEMASDTNLTDFLLPTASLFLPPPLKNKNLD